EATQLVPQTMSEVYKILPLTFKDKILTIAIGDPNNLSSVDDVRNLLGINEVVAWLSTPQAIAEATARFYAGKEISIMDVLADIENDPTLGRAQGRETSIDIGEMAEIADAAPV